MATFENPNGSFNNESGGGPVAILNTGTVVTVTRALAWNERDLIINNTSTLTTTVNVKLPLKPESGNKVEIGSIANVATLSVKDGFGNAITGTPTSLTAGAALVMRYINATLGWTKWK